MTKTGLVWFRNDLRIHDQISLVKAAKENSFVIAVYCFDPRHFEKDHFGFIKTENYDQFLFHPEDIPMTIINSKIFGCKQVYFK